MPRRATLDYEGLTATMPDVSRWHQHLLARSPDRARIDRDNLLRTLHEFRSIRPAGLLSLTQEELDETMQDFVLFFESRKNKLAGSTLQKYVSSVKSYLAWHGRKLVRPLYVHGAKENPVAEAQEIPSQEKVGALLMAGDLRSKFIAAMEAFAGMRPQVLGKSDASDGLRLKHFAELELTAEGPRFTQTPTLIKVPKHLSKTGKAYITFLGPQGCEIALLYWRTRMKKGEPLGPETPALVNMERGPPHILRRTNIQDILRFPMRRVGIRATTYILRSYFDNRLVVADVVSIYREFWMGHAGGLQTRYALRKESLPSDTIEKMRQAYARALPLLESHSSVTQTPPSASKAPQLTVAPATAPRLRQKVATLDALEALLEQGWLYKATLEGGKIIVEKPD